MRKRKPACHGPRRRGNCAGTDQFFPTHNELRDLSLLALAIGMVGFLYSSVGHAGASGYIAVMALAGIAPATIRPTALVLNILGRDDRSAFNFGERVIVAGVLFWPFAVLSVPAAYLGGYCNCRSVIFRILLGLVLLFSAGAFVFRRSDPPKVALPSPSAAISLGRMIGLLSGLTGTGGGIFLTPLLLFFRWAQIREAAAVSAFFILVNSIAGLGWLFHREPLAALPRSDSRRRRGGRRRSWFLFRQSPISSAHDFVGPGDRAHHCRNKLILTN